MAVNGHSRKLSDHIFNCNREVEREQELEVRWGCELSKPSTRDVPSPTRLYTTYPNSTTKWGSGAPTPQLIGGALLIQNTTVLITRSIWFWRGAYLDFFFCFSWIQLRAKFSYSDPDYQPISPRRLPSALVLSQENTQFCRQIHIWKQRIKLPPTQLWGNPAGNSYATQESHSFGAWTKVDPTSFVLIRNVILQT